MRAVFIDSATAHAACDARDRRYDGRFFVGVKSTGIYCRCVCTARTPRRENRTFHASAAAAESAGFRPCLLCRPELAPGLSRVDATERLAHDAIARIQAGALEEMGLEALATQLGISDRHLRRVVLDTFGATPVDLAQTHRLLTAKRLLRDTALSMTDVAFAAGFQSVRRFNTLFRERYGLTPSRVRGRGVTRDAALTFSLTPRGRFDGRPVWSHFAARAIDGLEYAPSPTSWRRSLVVGAHHGVITLELSGPTPQLTLSDSLVPAFRQVIAQVRGALDLDADLDVVHATLAHDFAKDLKHDPSVRLPGALDGFELAVRAVLGQQVTLRAGTTLATRLVRRFGAPSALDDARLTHLFPSATTLARARPADIAALGMPLARAETVVSLARAVHAGRLVLSRGAIVAGREGLERVPGIGPWTREYVALRALGDPDAFPHGDSALRAAFDGDLPSASEGWKPWRGYAAARLWRRVPPKSKKRGAAR